MSLFWGQQFNAGKENRTSKKMFRRKVILVMTFVQLCMRSYLCSSDRSVVMLEPSVTVNVDDVIHTQTYVNWNNVGHIPVYLRAHETLWSTKPTDNCFRKHGFGDLTYSMCENWTESFKTIHTVPTMTDFVNTYPRMVNKNSWKRGEVSEKLMNEA